MKLERAHTMMIHVRFAACPHRKYAERRITLNPELLVSMEVCHWSFLTKLEKEASGLDRTAVDLPGHRWVKLYVGFPNGNGQITHQGWVRPADIAGLYKKLLGSVPKGAI